MNIVKKSIFATALAATALTSAAPAMARDTYRSGSDRTGTAIAVGVVGLALGAIIASSANNHDRYRDSRYYRDGRYYENGSYYDNSRNYGSYDYRDGRAYGNDYDRGYYDRRGYRGY